MLAVERHTQAQYHSDPQTCENLGDLPDVCMQRSEGFCDEAAIRGDDQELWEAAALTVDRECTREDGKKTGWVIRCRNLSGGQNFHLDYVFAIVVKVLDAWRARLRTLHHLFSKAEAVQIDCNTGACWILLCTQSG